MKLRLGVALAAALLGVGCSHAGLVAETLADGSYRVRCRSSLAVCLDEGVETLCGGRSFVILRAVDQMAGPQSANAASLRTSEVVARCGPANGWGAPGRPPEASASCAQPLPGRSCVPGSTQYCVGVQACTGSQTCLPDGSGFSSCDCAGLVTVPATPYP